MHLNTHSPRRSRGRLAKQSQVGIGSTVTIRDVQTDEREVYTLVRPEDVDIDRDRISSYSPLGKSLGGRRAGDIVDIDAPAGILRYEIEAVLGPAEDLRTTPAEVA
jgi:transcription elongation GreA/GreB family factor